MKSIYDLLIEWHESNPNFKFLRYKKSYSLNDIIFEVEAISKSLLFVSSQHIGIYVKSKLDFIFIQFLFLDKILNFSPYNICEVTSENLEDFL